MQPLYSSTYTIKYTGYAKRHFQTSLYRCITLTTVNVLEERGGRGREEEEEEGGGKRREGEGGRCPTCVSAAQVQV